MRMNKKLKNVLAFGLATSFVLTSTMGVSATGDAVSYDDVTSYAATDMVTDVTKVLHVNFWDNDTNSQVGDVKELPHEFEATSADDATFTFAATSVEAPEGYTIVDLPSLTLHKNYEEDWVTVVVKKVETPDPTPTPEAVTKVLHVNFWDNDTNSQVGDVKELPHEFEATSADDATFTFVETSVEAPEGYTIVNLPSLTLHKNYEEDWVTVDVKKVTEASEAVTKVLHVNFWDKDTNSQVGDVKELPHEFEATSADDATFTFVETSVEAPEGYTIVNLPSLTLHKNYEEDWVTVDVKKVTEASEAVTKVLHVNFWDKDTNSQVGDVKELPHEFEATSADDATFTFVETSVEAPEGYTIVNLPSLTLHKNYEEDWVTVDVKKVTEASEAVTKVLHVNFWDKDTNSQVGDVKELPHEFEATSADDATFTFAATSVEAPEGYTIVNLPDLILHKAYEEDWVTIDVKKVEEEVQKTVKVVFSVDPTKGEFPGYEGSASIHYTIDEDSEEQYLVPEVKAADGYKFVGWQVEGKESGHWDADAKTFGVTGLANYPAGSNEGYLSIDAIFEAVETETEVQKTVKVVFSVDPAKGEFPGYDGAATINYTIDEDSAEQYLVPEVKAADGYKFVGWQVEGKESGHWDADAKTFGVTGLANYPKGSNEGYLSIDAIFEAVETETEVQKTVKVVFSVDPAKGEFPGYDGSTTIHYTIDEYSEEQYLVPEVKAADGYKFVGWQVEGKESGRWDADAKTFGVTGLGFYEKGSNEGYLSIDAIFEAVETEAPVTEPTTETPATETPTTEAPTTEAPTTEAPTTEAPTTEAPTTEAPTTEAPTTEAPTTEAPTTEAPTTEAPATEAPATEAPTTEAPATEAPTTEAPATEEPATEAPTSEPATEPTSESETKVTESETKTSEAPTTTKSDDNNSNKSADAGVKTGDTTNVMPLVITLFAAVALMVVFALRKRKVVK